MNAMVTARTDSPRSVPLLSAVRLFVMLLVAACGGDDLLLPRDGEPARIAPIQGTNVRATVGQPLTESLVAQVTDPAGRPVPGVEVTFVPPPGAVIDPAEPVQTDPQGNAAVHYTLSTTAGDQMVKATAEIVPESNAVATFHVAADPESPESLTIAGGDAQSAEVSTLLPDSLSVKAVDRYGNGVFGVEVAWQANGGGAVSPETVMTGSDGRAATARTLGDRPGPYGTAARAEGLAGSPIAFTATGVAAPQPALTLVIQPSEVAAAGVPLQRQPELQLQDPFGALLAQEGVSVTAQIANGNGSLGGKTTAKSDATGKVAFSDLELRGETGSRTLIFAADGFTPVTSSEIAVRPGPPSAEESAVQVPDGSAGSPTSITIRLKDEFGNPISDAATDIAISIDGANPTSNLPVIEEGNGSYSASYVPVHTGRDVISLQFRGEPLRGGRFESNVSPGPADAKASTARVTTNGVFFISVQVVVTARDAHGNLVGHGGNEVTVIPNGGKPRTAKDNGGGIYTDQFVLVGSSISVAILLDGTPIGGSPFTP
ncbi:MAG: Ig-like domain-containing protein [Gemmatimonadales bacterium]